MSLDQHIYGSLDWNLPSPSSTPKSATFPDLTLKTPKTEAFPQSHFLDAWSTPRVNGHQTPAQTPSFAFSTPIDRSSTSHSQKPRTPQDPDFHVNHFVTNNLSLPPVEPARRLSSSPGPHPVKREGMILPGNQTTWPASVSMDTSQMQTPPPTRHATSRRGLQQSVGNEFATPPTVIHRTPVPMPSSNALFNHTPLGFPSLQFSPEMLQFSNAGPMSAPPLPQSRLFWDQPNVGSQMDVDMSLASDPFGPTPQRMESNLNWQSFYAPAANNQMNPQAFHALHGVSPVGPLASSAASNTGNGNSRPNSFVSPSGGVDPSMLFSFSNPGPLKSFDNSVQLLPKQVENRQPYEIQLRDSLLEKESARKPKSQHSRTSTSSSAASLELNKPSLQRSNTDSGFRMSRHSSTDSRSSASTGGLNIPRRSSPLKRQSGASLMAIPEIRRPRTRLVIDDNGRARTETIPVKDDEVPDSEMRRGSQKDLRQQYPGLWADDDSETEEDEPVTLSRNASFSMPQRSASKHARADSSELNRSSSFKVARSSSRPSSGVFDQASFDTIRPVRRVADNAHRRFSMMDFPTPFNDNKEKQDEAMPDSPGNALGALRKVVEGRQKRTDRSAQHTLRAHNQRWAQASADLATTNTASYDPFTNSFIGSPSTGFTTPSTDRSSLSGDSTRCVCNGGDDGQSMVQCESCNKWLHMGCVGIQQGHLPPVYVCVFCTGQTPVVRGGRVRGPMPAPFESPLTHKSVFRR